MRWYPPRARAAAGGARRAERRPVDLEARSRPPDRRAASPIRPELPRHRICPSSQRLGDGKTGKNHISAWFAGFWWAAQTAWAQQEQPPVHDPFAEGGPLEEQEPSDNMGWAFLAIVLLVASTGAAAMYCVHTRTAQATASLQPLAEEGRYLGWNVRKQEQHTYIKDKKFRYASNRPNEIVGSELRLAPDEEDGED